MDKKTVLTHIAIISLSIPGYFGYLMLRPKEVIITVKTDIIDNNSEAVPLSLLKDENYIMQHLKNNDEYDVDYRVAIFYSECAIQLLAEANDLYNSNLFLVKGIQKWDKIIEHDPSARYFKQQYLDRISKHYVQNRAK
jgi:hypothetical protein